KEVNDSSGHAAGDDLIRQTGSFLRELFPSYGVHEVLGRLGGDEFAALTTDRKCASRSELLLAARVRQGLISHPHPLSLRLGLPCRAHPAPRAQPARADRSRLKRRQRARALQFQRRRFCSSDRPPAMSPPPP